MPIDPTSQYWRKPPILTFGGLDDYTFSCEDFPPENAIETEKGKFRYAAHNMLQINLITSETIRRYQELTAARKAWEEQHAKKKDETSR